MVEEISNLPSEILSENLEAQYDEVLVLKSIYSENFTVINEEERTFEIILKLSDSRFAMEIIFRFTMVPEYPLCGPNFSISAPNLPRYQLDNLIYYLNEVRDSSIGSPMIHSMIERLHVFLDKFHDAYCANEAEEIVRNSEKLASMSFQEHLPLLAARSSQYEFSDVCDSLQIYHGDPITDRKSVFQAHCCHVSSLSQVYAFIDKMLEDNKVAAATHNIKAWCLRTKPSESSQATSLIADFDDDGETHAGSRLLHLLQLAAVEGVVVMVSRWYGGTKLGPDRFKRINNAASKLLSEHNLLKSSKESGKRKAKHKEKK